jgi:hypothetical protein
MLMVMMVMVLMVVNFGTMSRIHGLMSFSHGPFAPGPTPGRLSK